MVTKVGRLVLMIVLVGLVACATAYAAAKSPAVSEMSDSEKVTAAKAVYEKYNKDYQNRSKVSGLNDAAKEELQRRKKILDEAGPKIKAYDEAVKGNLPIDKDLAKWMDAFLKKYTKSK
jgi:hypothetical protein